MNEITALYTVRNNYALFRMALESFFRFIPSEQCDDIIIMNDGSNEEDTIKFLEYLNGNTIGNKHIRVINTTGPTDWSFYTKYGRGEAPIKKALNVEKATVSMGHGGSINEGLKHVKTDYVLTLDSDIMMLPRSVNLLARMLKCFSLDEKVLVVSQLTGKIDGVHVCNNRGRLIDGTYFENFPNACFMMCDMKSWKTHNLKLMGNGGWAHSPYIYDLYIKGFRTCNFNTFKDGYVIHLGYGTLRQSREQEEVRTFGFTKDSLEYGRVKRGGILNEWYAGYYNITLTTEELLEYMNKSYVNLSYDVRKSIIENIIPKEIRE